MLERILRYLNSRPSQATGLWPAQGQQIQVDLCPACRAKDRHIEDLRNLLNDERAQRNGMIQILLGVRTGTIPINSADSAAEPHNLRTGYTSNSDLRRKAREAESDKAAGETSEFWRRREAHFEEAERKIKERIIQRTGFKEDPTDKPVDQSDNFKGDLNTDSGPQPSEAQEFREVLSDTST